MINTYPKQEVHPVCGTKRLSYGVAGTNTAKFYSGHGKDVKDNVMIKSRAELDCTTHHSLGMTGSIRMLMFCEKYTEEDIVRFTSYLVFTVGVAACEGVAV